MKVYSRSQGQVIDTSQMQTGTGLGEMDTETDIASGGGMDALRQLLLMQALSQAGSTKGGRFLEMYKSLEPEKPSAEEQKRKFAKGDAETVMRQLEDMYFFSERGPLAYGGDGDFLRKQGRVENFLATQQSGYNPQLATYLATRDSIKPRFARAMGDVGNLSKPEQEQAVKNIPTGANAYEEAKMFFNEKRKTMGLPERDFDTELSTQGITESIRGNGETLPLPIKAEQKGRITTQQKEQITPTGMPLDQMSALQRLFGTTEETYKPNLPGAKYAGEAGMLAGPLTGKLTGLPPGLRTLVSGGVGQTYENIGREGLPLTQQAGQPYKPQGVIEKLATLNPATNLFATQKNRQLLGQTAPAAILDVLFSMNKLRNMVGGGKAGTPISGEKVAEAGMEYAGQAPATGRQAAGKYALEGIEKFGGKELSVLEALKEATRSQTQAFTSRGIGRPIASKFEGAIAQNLRNQISQTSPLTGYLTTGIAKMIQAQNALKSLLKVGAIPLALYAGSRYLGGKLGD